MIRFLALALALAAGASAQVPPGALSGAWHVDRYTYSEPDTSDALLPEGLLLAYTAARFEPDGALTVTMTVADRQGYSVQDVPMTYTLDGDHVSVDLGDLVIRFAAVLDGDTLALSNDEGTMYLRRDR